MRMCPRARHSQMCRMFRGTDGNSPRAKNHQGRIAEIARARCREGWTRSHCGRFRHDVERDNEMTSSGIRRALFRARSRYVRGCCEILSLILSLFRSSRSRHRFFSFPFAWSFTSSRASALVFGAIDSMQERIVEATGGSGIETRSRKSRGANKRRARRESRGNRESRDTTWRSKTALR